MGMARIRPFSPVFIDLEFTSEHVAMATWLHERAAPFFFKPLGVRVRPVFFDYKSRITLEVMK